MFKPAGGRSRRRGARPRLRPAQVFRDVIFRYSYASALQAETQAAQPTGCYEGIDSRLANLQPCCRLPNRHRSILRRLERLAAPLGCRLVQGGRYCYFNPEVNYVLRNVYTQAQ
jgi:hypothetical protein